VKLKTVPGEFSDCARDPTSDTGTGLESESPHKACSSDKGVAFDAVGVPLVGIGKGKSGIVGRGGKGALGYPEELIVAGESSNPEAALAEPDTDAVELSGPALRPLGDGPL